MGTREVNSTNKQDMTSQIKAAIDEGQCIAFSNGCWLNLKDDEGVYFGATPYGLDRACNVNDGNYSAITEWINYWNEDRTETGELM